METDMALTETRKDLLQALTQVQNHPAHNHHDILTITGCGMTDDEVRAHIETNVEQIINWNMEQANKPSRKRRVS
jgi:Fe2+ or Zn2+ uptake regulation protein